MLNDDGAKAVRRLVTLAPGAAAGPIRAAEYRRCRIDQADCAPEAGAARRGFQQTRDGPRPVALMEALGFGRFAVVGHDRGARVAYRMALDHPERVERLAVLNVIPTVDQFERMTGGPSLGYWPWFLLALPAPFPEQLIAAAPEQFLRFVFDSWTADPTAIDDDAFAVYLAAFTPAAASICADYRASFWLDNEHDRDDRRISRYIECPTLVITGAEETQLADGVDVWREWAPDVSVHTAPGGHFIREEAPEGKAAPGVPRDQLMAAAQTGCRRA